jgi:hypothetical protein
MDLSLRMYIIMCRLYEGRTIGYNGSARWKTRRHSEVSVDYLKQHFASNKFSNGKLSAIGIYAPLALL